MQNDRFEWDDDKARRNLAKHEVSFEVGCLVFDDPNFVDERNDHPDEERFRVTGMVGAAQITVIYTERGNRIRIISARPATHHEQENYFNQNG